MFTEEDILSWDSDIEKILNDQRVKCASYKWMHELQMKNILNKHKKINILTISIVSLSATASTITNNDAIVTNNQYIVTLNLIYSILFYFTAFLNSLQQFLNYQKIAEQHRTAALRYNALHNNIKRMLVLDKENRHDAREYFNWANKEFDNINLNSPDISEQSINEFNKNFRDSNTNKDKDTYSIKSGYSINNDSNDIEKRIESDGKDDVGRKKMFQYEFDRFMVNSFHS